MKKLVFVMVIVVIQFTWVQSMWAYSGVSGQLLDENGNPWLHGGEVYV